MLPFAVLFLLAEVARGAPTVSFPLNAQVPPVARISQPFSFQFSDTTFASATGPLQYALSGNTSWLSLDAAERKLWGTPGPSDAGSVDFTVIATDTTGSVSMQSTLLVATDSPPQVDANVTASLLKAGKLSGPTTLALYPSTEFTVGFPDDTFTSSDGKSVSYYATMSNHTPLPAWVIFKPEDLSFSGTTPTFSAFPQNFEILLIASDAPGFAGAWLKFSLVISNHQFTFSERQQTVDTTPGEMVEVMNLKGLLLLDDQKVGDSDLQSATANVPSWLSFDQKTLSMQGKAPKDVEATDVTVSVTDKFGDTANTTVQFSIRRNISKGEIGTINIVPGEPVNYPLKELLSDQTDSKVSVDFGDAAKWLQLDQGTMTIRGTIPSSVEPQTIQGKLSIIAPDGPQNDSKPFDIVVKRATPTSSTVASRHPTSTNSATTTAAKAAETPNKTKSKSNIVVIAVSVTCLVLAIIAFILAILCCRYPRKFRLRKGSEASKISKPDISRPMGCNDWEVGAGALESPRNLGGDLEKGEGTFQPPQEPPPQIPCPSPLKQARIDKRISALSKKFRQSMGSSIGDRDAAVLASFNRSGDWSLEANAATRTPRISLKLANNGTRPESGEGPPSRRHSHRPVTAYRDSTGGHYRDNRRSIGIPARQRLMGLGHGRGSYGSSSRRLSALKSRVRNSYSSFSTLSTGMLSPAPSTCLVPTTDSTGNRFSNADTIQKSVRIVPESTDGSAVKLDTRPLGERRQSYIRHRAQNRSPFFAARGSSSRSSSHRPSIIGTLAESLASVEDNGTSASGSGSGMSETRQYPGSLRHKGARRWQTARAYSESSSVEPVKRWRKPSETGVSGSWNDPYPRPVPSPSLRSSERVGMSESVYSETEGSNNNMDMSGMSALSLGMEEMELDERDEYAYENRSDGVGHHQPSAYFSPVPEPLKLSKERLSSPMSAQGTSANDPTIPPPPVTPPPPRAQRNSQLRVPSGRMERDSLGNIVHYLSAGETPTIEELNYAIAIHKSGTMSQGRRSQNARLGSTPRLPPPTPTRLSQASTVRASRLSPSRLSRLSSAVRQQLASQAAGTSVINRGHPRVSARFSSNGGNGSGTNTSSTKPPSRTPLATISSSNVNLQNAGLGSAATTGAKLVEAPKGKRPISVERTGRWSSLRGVKEGTPAQNEGSQPALGTSPIRGNEAFL